LGVRGRRAFEHALERDGQAPHRVGRSAGRRVRENARLLQTDTLGSHPHRQAGLDPGRERAFSRRIASKHSVAPLPDRRKTGETIRAGREAAIAERDEHVSRPGRVCPDLTSASAIERSSVALGRSWTWTWAEHRPPVACRPQPGRSGRLRAAPDRLARPAGQPAACGRCGRYRHEPVSACPGNPWCATTGAPFPGRSASPTHPCPWPTMMYPFSARSACMVSVP